MHPGTWTTVSAEGGKSDKQCIPTRSHDMKTSHPSVLLFSLPWTAITEPSLGLGILKAQLTKEGIPCRISHANLFLLKYLRASTYFGLTNMYGVNDFLFTYVFENEISTPQLSELALRVDEAIEFRHFGPDQRYTNRESVAEMFLVIRNEIIPSFLEDCLRIVGESEATMVGFTCMFDQTIASLALAKLVRERYPDQFLVLGGYALEGPPGEQVIRSFDFIDCVAYGEGENIIGKIAHASIDPGILDQIPNILYRDPASGIVKQTPTDNVWINMDDSPAPDYDDFVKDLEELKAQHEVTIQWRMLPIETSRGCWWGQKKHCTFCGIDDSTMQYRQRSKENTINILKTLKSKYSNHRFRISDYILPNNYYKTLLPYLAALPENEKYVFTCELKANVTHEKFQLLKNAGFVEVQPGIESFSSSVLRNSDKGVTAIQNIFCLLMGLKHGIRVNYNFLFGFPNDKKEDYEEMLKIIPYLYHLNPPSSRVKVAITRFAPLQVDPTRFSIPDTQKHAPGYDVIFSPEFLAQHDFNMTNYCYYFEPTYTPLAELKNLYRLLCLQIDYWRKCHDGDREAKLIFRKSGENITFLDSRYTQEPKESVFHLNYATLYTECTERVISISALKKKLSHTSLNGNFDSILEHLIKQRFIFREGSKVIGLAIEEDTCREVGEKSTHWSGQYI